MTEPRRQLRIRTAADLHAALVDPDTAVRMAVLQMIARQPAQALAYGRHDGRDVIDVLLQLAAGPERRGSWEVVVATLTVFHGPRVVEFFKRLLSTARRAQTLFAAATRLRHEPIASLQDFVRPLLMQNESDARARAAARLLIWAPDLDAAARLRSALLAGRRRVRAPLLTADTASEWLSELNGLAGVAARGALEAQGEPALAVLAAHWDELVDGDRTWLLDWSAALVPATAVALCKKALASRSRELALAALECVPSLGEHAAALAPALASLATAADPMLRLAAIEAGVGGLDFRTMLAMEMMPALRRACVRALARGAGAAALPDLVATLRDADWGVRAAATEAMYSLGDAIVPALEPLTRDPDAHIRTAAVQVLVRLGRETWLEEELLA